MNAPPHGRDPIAPNPTTLIYQSHMVIPFPTTGRVYCQQSAQKEEMDNPKLDTMKIRNWYPTYSLRTFSTFPLHTPSWIPGNWFEPIKWIWFLLNIAFWEHLPCLADSIDWFRSQDFMQVLYADTQCQVCCRSQSWYTRYQYSIQVGSRSQQQVGSRSQQGDHDSHRSGINSSNNVMPYLQCTRLGSILTDRHMVL